MGLFAKKPVFILGMFALYLIGVIVFHRSMGSVVYALSAFPVVSVAALYGLKRGIAMYAFCTVFCDTMLSLVLNLESLSVGISQRLSVGALVGAGIGLLVTAMIGRMRDMNLKIHRLHEQVLERNTDLSQALAEIQTLKGIIPICSNCKNIRDDQGYWNVLEQYLQQHSEAEFSHGICPDCARELYPEFDLYDSVGECTS